MPYFGIPIRNGLPIGLGSVAGFGIAPFEPYSLFENGEQGAWYDPSDFSTLFDDSAGTTPVTGVEQFVGLMLDKSKGLVLGPELVDTANTAAAWTPYGSNTVATISNGVAITFVNDARGALLTFNAAGGLSGNLDSTKIYRFSITLQLNTGTATVNLTNVTPAVSFPTITTTPQTVVFYTTRTAFTPELAFDGLSSGEILSVTNVSVRELPGNHATQTNSAKRPKLAARYNLLTYTEDFSNAAWGTGISGGASAATKSTTTGLNPNGVSTTIDVITFPAVSGGQASFLFQNTGQALLNVSTTATVYARVQSGTGTIYVNVEDNGAAPSGGNFYAGTAQTLTTTWQRLSISGTRTVNVGGTIVTIGFDTRAAAGQTNAAPLVVELWGADFRPTSQATGLIGPTYQRVVDAATYDTAGFLPYLEFNGLSWSMSTNSIDFSAVPTDKMTVWAGVRKQADPVYGCLAELSANDNLNNGAFSLFAPALGDGFSYSFASKGTIKVAVGPGISAYPAPITSVVAGISNISGPAVTLRVNGVQAATSTSSQGTGNFGNYPLFIGQRAASSLPFNGWLTSLIVRGAQSTQSQIEATESWVNGKTGAYV
jgi:hypothetical protein